MWLTEEDYSLVIGSTALTITQQSDQSKRDRAERAAIEEISGYLRPKYDVDRIFAAVGEDRNRQIMMYCADIALYHLTTWLPGKMGIETREKRYDRAIAWLKDVQKGITTPDIPLSISASGETVGGSSFGSMEKNDYTW